MGADREAMSLVAQSLEVVKGRVRRRQLKGRLVRPEELFASGIPVRALGDGRQIEIAGDEAERLKGLARSRELSRSAVYEDEVRPGLRTFAWWRVFGLFLQSGEAAAHHLSHHSIVVAWFEISIFEVERSV